MTNQLELKLVTWAVLPALMLVLPVVVPQAAFHDPVEALPRLEKVMRWDNPDWPCAGCAELPAVYIDRRNSDQTVKYFFEKDPENRVYLLPGHEFPDYLCVAREIVPTSPRIGGAVRYEITTNAVELAERDRRLRRPGIIRVEWDSEQAVSVRAKCRGVVEAYVHQPDRPKPR